MNKTKAKGLIKKLLEIKYDIGAVEEYLMFENLLSYCYDYIDITINELKKRYNIK